jgi:hypothetical protein
LPLALHSLSAHLMSAPGSGFESSEDRMKKQNSEEGIGSAAPVALPPSSEPTAPSSSSHGYIQLQQQQPSQHQHGPVTVTDPTTMNPLFLETAGDVEKQKKADESVPSSCLGRLLLHSSPHSNSHLTLIDLTHHPLWSPGLPHGRLHHHYHRHHSHKLELSKVPWIKFFTHSAPLALFINTFAQGWVGLMILTEMPAFLHQRLGCDISHSGYLSILPYLCNLIAVELFSLGFNWCMV